VIGALISFMADASNETVESRVARARNGDAQARENLIRDYMPFVLKTASAATRRFLVVGQDEEVSVALQAFDEAMMAYTSPKPGFVAFAATVIRRRLIDYFRKEKRRNEAPFSSLVSEEDDDWPESIGALEANPNWEQTLERRDEMERWKDLLRQYGLSLDRVVKRTPKHADARGRAIRLAALVAETDELREKFVTDRKLPIDDMLDVMRDGLLASKKTVERQKDYITAVAVMLTFEFPTLQEFLDVSVARGVTR
jgi:RNA polymerase sigma factor